MSKEILSVNLLDVTYPKRNLRNDNYPITVLSRMKEKNERVLISISGTRYETLASTLNKYPETLLGTREKRSRLMHNSQIFLNRHRGSFDAILFYYQSSGNLTLPPGVAMEVFEHECEYFGICQSALQQMKEKQEYLHKYTRYIPAENKYSKRKKHCWIFCDFPNFHYNYIYALSYFIFSFGLIVISIAVYCIDTELSFAYEGEKLKKITEISNTIELALNIYFAFELLSRFYIHPLPRRFIRKPLNIIESISIFTYLLVYFIPKNIVTEFLLSFARSLRCIRLIRLGKILHPIKVAASVFKASISDIAAVISLTIIICIFFGSIMYYVEMVQSHTDFTSIPQSMWWALQTIVTLGYGDIVPDSNLSKYIAIPMVLFGVIIETVILSNLGGRMFRIFYRENKKGNDIYLKRYRYK